MPPFIHFKRKVSTGTRIFVSGSFFSHLYHLFRKVRWCCGDSALQLIGVSWPLLRSLLRLHFFFRGIAPQAPYTEVGIRLFSFPLTVQSNRFSVSIKLTGRLDYIALTDMTRHPKGGEDSFIKQRRCMETPWTAGCWRRPSWSFPLFFDKHRNENCC